jgi:tagatose 1,6-diphosphate aldolase GatY/KbaY
MLVPFRDVLGQAQRGSAMAAFTCYDLEVAAAVLETAAREDRSVIVLVSPSSVRGDHGEAFLSAVLAYAERAPAHSCVQVDHVDDLQLIERVLQLGAGAVMADGSRLPLDENIALVRAAVGLASATGAAVEAELGRVEGDEDLAQAAREGRLTEPQEARRFVEESGAACLAVSIGNAHGRYSAPPSLDWDRLEAIRAQVTVPLALHGASGLADASIQRALELGIGKVNINTELREAYLRATAEALGDLRETAAVGDLHRTQTVAVAGIVASKLRLLRPEGGP